MSRSPRRLSGAALALMAGLTIAAIPAASSVAAPKCDAAHPGSYQHKYGSAKARTFCGPATATVHYQGRTIQYRGGYCTISKGLFAINIGTAVSGVKNLPKYFGLDISYQRSAHGYRGTGDFRAFGKGHPMFSIPVTFSSSKLSAKHSKGSFSGTVFGGSAVSGSFHCS